MKRCYSTYFGAWGFRQGVQDGLGVMFLVHLKGISGQQLGPALVTVSTFRPCRSLHRLHGRAGKTKTERSGSCDSKALILEAL